MHRTRWIDEFSFHWAHGEKHPFSEHEAKNMISKVSLLGFCVETLLLLVPLTAE